MNSERLLVKGSDSKPEVEQITGKHRWRHRTSRVDKPVQKGSEFSLSVCLILAA